MTEREEGEKRRAHGKDAPANERSWAGKAVIFAVMVGAFVFGWPAVERALDGTGPSKAVVAENSPPWRESYTAALAEARASGKPVLIDFTASWCPPCRVMEAEVWPDPEVRAALERLVPLQIDVDKPASAEVTHKYGIRSIPTIILVDGEGQELARGNFMSAQSLLGFLSAHLRPVAP